jgi:hypothetical protein
MCGPVTMQTMINMVTDTTSTKRPHSPKGTETGVNDEKRLMWDAFGQRGLVVGSWSRVSGSGKGGEGRCRPLVVRRGRERRDEAKQNLMRATGLY